MFATILPVTSLLLGVGILLLGSGLFSTLLAVRGNIEGFSDLSIGLITSGYFAGFLIGTLACPGIIRRVGHIRAYALFASIASATPIWHGLVIDPWAWGLLRMAAGACLVGLYMVIESWLNAQSPNEQRGRIFSVYMIVTFIALAAGQFLLLARPPAAFDLFGVIATLFSLSLVPIALTSMTQPAPPPDPVPRLGLQGLHAIAPVGVAGALVSGFAMGAFWGLSPLYASRLGLEEAGIAAFMSAAILGGAALQWPIGMYSDLHDRRRVLAVVAAGAALAALLALVMSYVHFVLLLICFFAFGGLGFSIYSVSVAHLNDRLTAEQMLHGSSGLLLIHGIGAAIGPILAGASMALFGAGGLLVYFAAVLILFGVYAWYQLPARELPEPHPQPFVPMVRTTPTAFEMLPVTEQTPPSPSPSSPEGAEK
jgi:MFS family permease